MQEKAAPSSVTVKRSYPAKLLLVENQSVMDSVANGDISHPLPILPPAWKVMGVGGETEEGNEIMQAHQEKISVGGSKVGECVVGITSWWGFQEGSRSCPGGSENKHSCINS